MKKRSYLWAAFMARPFGMPIPANWFMLAAPAGLPPAITERLGSAVREILAEPAIRERMESIAFVQADNVPQPGLGAWVQAETARWAPVVRASGASM